MYKIKYTPLAENDLISVLEHYYSLDINIFKNFLFSISKIETQIKVGPEIYRIRYKNYRRVNLHKFPYALFFEIIDKEIIILRILHQKQDPIFWP